MNYSVIILLWCKINYVYVLYKFSIDFLSVPHKRKCWVSTVAHSSGLSIILASFPSPLWAVWVSLYAAALAAEGLTSLSTQESKLKHQKIVHFRENFGHECRDDLRSTVVHRKYHVSSDTRTLADTCQHNLPFEC